MTKPYHHGDLPAALLAAAETILRRDGIAGLGMRAIAREAGVSHTAAKPHFGDITGLLSELAAVGYHRLASALRDSSGETDRARRVALAKAYVDFARDNPALFGLMFRGELVDMRRPSLQTATAAAIAAMGRGSTDLTHDDAIAMTAAWAYVHGLATLLVDKRLHGIIKRTTAFADPQQLVDAVIDGVALGRAKQHA